MSIGMKGRAGGRHGMGVWYSMMLTLFLNNSKTMPWYLKNLRSVYWTKYFLSLISTANFNLLSAKLFNSWCRVQTTICTSPIISIINCWLQKYKNSAATAFPSEWNTSLLFSIPLFFLSPGLRKLYLLNAGVRFLAFSQRFAKVAELEWVITDACFLL